MTYALLAFDLDGTLADSESIAIPNMVTCLQEDFGIPITEEHYWQHYHGIGGTTLIAKLNAEFGTQLEWETFLPIRQARLPAMFANGIPAAPGVLQAIKLAAAEGALMCICSNSSPERIRQTLTSINGQHSAGLFLDKFFDNHLFSAADPANPSPPKPAPHVYMAATARYGVNPAECLAVEDSPAGVASALGAGFGYVLGYTGTSHTPQQLAQSLQETGATAILSHWDDFFPMLQTLPAHRRA